MLLRLFEETKLMRANMLVLEKEIRDTFRGRVLYLWERGFDATSVIHENVFFFDDSSNAQNKDASTNNWGIRVKAMMGYDVLSLSFYEDAGTQLPVHSFTAQFESGDDDPIAVWLSAETLLIKNRRRPINAKVPIRELYITAVA